MTHLDIPQWLANLEDEDISFIKRFVLASGSLKEMAQQYGVSYPTVRLRLDRLIQKIRLGEEAEAEPYISLIKRLALNDKLDFDTAKLLIGEYRKIKCMAVDLSGNGGDLCVATLVESISDIHFKVTNREEWNEPDTDITKGKIINLYAQWQPDILILDADGMGYPIYVSVQKAIPRCLAFNGSGKSNRQNAYNQRADGYMTLKDFIDNEWLEIPHDDTRDQIEFTKKEYRTNGTVIIQKKEELKEEIGESPDKADSLMMAIYGLNYFSYMANIKDDYEETTYMDTSYDPFD